MKNLKSLLILALCGTTLIFGNDATNESLENSRAEKNELSVPQDPKEVRPAPKKLKKKKSKLNSESANSKASENDAPPAPPIY